MNEFFQYINRTDYDQIYNSFSPEHIFIFCAFAAGFIVICIHSGDPSRIPALRRLEKISLTVMSAGQLTYFFWFWYTNYGGDKWPLYACRIACILMVFTYFVRWMPLEQFSVYTAMYGGISSVFWSTPKPFAFPHVTRIAFFATHIGLAYSALLRIMLHDEEIDRKTLRGAETVNCVVIAAVLALDIKYDWNYMFLITPDISTQFLNDSSEPLLRQILLTSFVVAVYIFAVFAAWFFARWLQAHFSPMHVQIQSQKSASASSDDFEPGDLRPSVRESSLPKHAQLRLEEKVSESDEK
ncbi:MAG: YwaF family protein [Eubacteriales bacterium]|nr:YwaF family protein [Eubacteriales bacterium]